MTTTDANDSTVDIAQLARLTGVTSRTLRHYDSIGLLNPAWTGADGRRHYSRPELLRLQHILVLRELGTSLDRIGRIVDAHDPAETVAQLRDHLAGLTAERDRYTRLAATVARTIDSLEKGKSMTETQLFDGFDHTPYEPEARERWGDATVDASNAHWERLGDDGKRRHMQTDREIVEALGAAVRVHLAPNSPEVQEVIARHHAWVSVIWTPDADAYRGLTQMYVDDERFRSHYDEVAPGAAQLLRDGAEVYANTRL
ncbi:MAG: MerR family transcriptional regulator [Demequina sp.]